VKKLVLIAAVLTVPILAIAVREAVRYAAAGADPSRKSPGSLLFLLGAGMALIPLWTGVNITARLRRRLAARTPFDVTAAITIAQARKRPPAPRCPRCDRPRLVESSLRCAFCGEPWSAP
jgi:hypothetical protein